MANLIPTVRKNLRALDSPVELRELNRQLEWIWKMLLGGLTMKSFAKGSIGEITKTVEHIITEDIVADSIDVKELKAAIAEIMYADIGIAKIDFAKIGDLIANMIITEDGIAKKFFIQDLEVVDANIVDLTANKITGGTLDVGNINAVNGDFAVITAGMINGMMIVPGTYLADDLRIGSADDVLEVSGCVNFDSENNIEAVKEKHRLGSVIGDQYAQRQHRLKDKSEEEKYELLHNTPGDKPTCFSWKNLVIEYNGVDYYVTDGYTNGSYVYWLKDYPHQLYASNMYIVLSEGDCLLYLNKNGVAVTVPGAKTIDGSLIVSGTVQADAIAANAISADKIAAFAIQAGAIAAGAVISDKIAAGAIQADHIAANAVTADKIIAEAITAGKIAAGAIKAASLDVVDILANSALIGELAASEAFIGDLISNDAFINDLVADDVFAEAFIAQKALIKEIFAEKIISNGSLTISDAFDSLSGEIDTAAGEAEDAYNKALSAEESALDASGKADSAIENANSAFAQASSAAQNAANALDEATTAQGHAESAQNAADTAESAAKAARDEIKEYLHFDTSSGLWLGSKEAGEVNITRGQINMVTGGEVFSVFGAGYLDLGNDIRIRAPRVGGIAFAPRGG